MIDSPEGDSPSESENQSFAPAEPDQLTPAGNAGDPVLGSPEGSDIFVPDRGPRFLVVLLILTVINVTVFFLLWNSDPRPSEGDRVTAQLFLDGLVFGIADAPDQEITGYSLAYDQLSDAARAKWDFARFSEHFENQVSEWGYLISWTPLPDEKGGVARRRLAFRLDFEGRQEQGLSFHCELVLIPVEDGHRVDRWEITPVDRGESTPNVDEGH